MCLISTLRFSLFSEEHISTARQLSYFSPATQVRQVVFVVYVDGGVFICVSSFLLIANCS